MCRKVVNIIQFHASLSAKSRYYLMDWILGDLHGKLSALKSLTKLVRAKDPDCVFHFVGDYIDRGEDSKGVVDFILALGDKATYIRGNHDDIFDTILNGPSPYADTQGAMESVNQLLWFLRQGMVETLESYSVPGHLIAGIISIDETEGDAAALRILNEIRTHIPQEHKDFFKNLPLVNEQKDFFCVHAYLPFYVEDNIQKWAHNKLSMQKGMLWGRFSEIAIMSSKRWKKTGYFGHSPTYNYVQLGAEEPIIGPKIRLVDTGCVFGHKLTAMCHETGEFIQV
jgi:serine/threonine protein phosphatase 1